MMNEITVNLHIHTTYSDGTGSHQDLIQAALQTKVDAIIATDHNVRVKGLEGYYGDEERSVLLLVGEETHDRTRDPQKNHLLIFGMDETMVDKAKDPQTLIEAVRKGGGLSFIAHPIDPAAPAVDQPNISWVNWDVNGYTGIELWNAFSEFKSLLKSKLHAIFYAYCPQRIARGPFRETLNLWDSLTSTGKRIAAVGGSDAHALQASMGPLHRTVFPYRFHFQGVNTHLLTPHPLRGNIHQDKEMVWQAFREGHAFIGYDLPRTSKGFRYKAHGKNETVIMGDEISAKNGVTLQITLPNRAECHLIKDGKLLKRWQDRKISSHTTTEPGVYRVESYLFYKGKKRGWIYSNPIYVRP
ncbi:MAG: CehA/McbA family metallohydrolase [Anaerolineales bacterium]